MKASGASPGEVLWCLKLVQCLKERAGRWFFFFGREGEGEAVPVTGGESQEGAGVEEGAADPVLKERRREEKDKAAT